MNAEQFKYWIRLHQEWLETKGIDGKQISLEEIDLSDCVFEHCELEIAVFITVNFSKS